MGARQTLVQSWDGGSDYQLAKESGSIDKMKFLFNRVFPRRVLQHKHPQTHSEMTLDDVSEVLFVVENTTKKGEFSRSSPDVRQDDKTEKKLAKRVRSIVKSWRRWRKH